MTGVDDATLLAAVAETFSLGAVRSATPHHGGSNRVWRLEAAAGAFAIHELLGVAADPASLRRGTAIAGLELAALAAGVPLAAPVLTPGGRQAIAVPDPARRPITVHEWIDAAPVEGVDPGNGFRTALGSALALVHGIDPATIGLPGHDHGSRHDRMSGGSGGPGGAVAALAGGEAGEDRWSSNDRRSANDHGSHDDGSRHDRMSGGSGGPGVAVAALAGGDVLARRPDPETWRSLAARARGRWAWADELARAADELASALGTVDAWTDRAGRRVCSHRDLTPANVLDRGGSPVLIDWESAGLIGPGDELGRTALDHLGVSADLARGPLEALLSGYAAVAPLPDPGPDWCALAIRALVVFVEQCAESCVAATAPKTLLDFQSAVVAVGPAEVRRRLALVPRWVDAFGAAADAVAAGRPAHP